MNHISEDKLLELALEIIEDDAERDAIEKHLQNCSQCSQRLETIRSDIGTIAGVKGPIIPLPAQIYKRKRHISYTILRVAALLVFGFAVGYTISNIGHHEQVNVVPSYLNLSPPPDSLIGSGVCDATEISPQYYDYILKNE
jgi:hypothetical protein